jgi:uncharacterized membrane protein YbhN (UPF0104 family)
MRRRIAAARAAARGIPRDLPWNALRIALPAGIIAVAVAALYRLLRGIEPDRIVSALQHKSAVVIVLAAVCVVAAYVNFSFYDLFALRTIGKRVPYRIAALASYCAYGIANNLGLTLIVSGAVRYRIYAPLGLTLVDVAKIAFVATLTYALGNALILCGGMAILPDAAAVLDRLPIAANRVIGCVGLLGLAAYLVWIWRRPRVIGQADWLVNLPNLPRTVLQIGIGMTDVLCSAAAVYLLMPGDAGISFFTVLVVFAASAALGFMSAAPGGIGVFDAAMLFSFQSLDREEMLATLLLYRFLYYVAPFAGALLTLGVREIWMQVIDPRRRMPPDGAA